jgi:hypothetical protein
MSGVLDLVVGSLMILTSCVALTLFSHSLLVVLSAWVVLAVGSLDFAIGVLKTVEEGF